MITQKENLKNMKRCPRFNFCNIPKCPLDFWMSKRIELPEDERCILISPRGKRVKGKIRGSLKRLIGKYVWKHNRNRNIPLPPCSFKMNGAKTQN